LDNPAHIRTIFGDNLRLLSREHPSITSLSHRLGINRTQLNRYLAGDSFPRPDILDRICTFFGVDARILLEPLEQIRSKTTAEGAAYLNDFVNQGARDLQDQEFPSGIYRFSRRSFINSDTFVVGLVLVFREGPHTYLKGYETPKAMRIQGLPVTSEAREFRGIALRQEEGIAILASRRNAMTSSFNYLSRVASFENNFWVGYATRTIPENVMGVRATRLVYELLPQNAGSVLTAARNSGFHTLDKLEPFHRRLLRPEVDFA